MRILHVTATSSGGAGRGLVGLHQGLLELGVDSCVLSADPPSERSEMLNMQWSHRALTLSAMKADRLILRALSGQPRETFHMPWIPTLMPEAIRRFEPDLLHLHWLRNLMTARQVANLSARYRTVWTIRDLAPFTGGCHYADRCDRFTESCGSCPLLPRGHKRDATYWTLRAKLRFQDYSSITPVALSRWLAGQAARSRVFGGRPVHVIHPGVDTSAFVPHERGASRRGLSLFDDVSLVGFVALQPLREIRKGWRLLDQALTRSDLGGQSLRALVTVTADELVRAGLTSSNWIPVGRVQSDHELAKLYSACDIVAVPSTEEAFGKVAAEAMACGVPVVAFDKTGVADVVQHLTSGYLARHGDVDDFSAGIQWAIASSRDEESRRSLHAEAKSRFGLQKQAADYIALYKTMVRTQGTSHG